MLRACSIYTEFWFFFFIYKVIKAKREFPKRDNAYKYGWWWSWSPLMAGARNIPYCCGIYVYLHPNRFFIKRSLDYISIVLYRVFSATNREWNWCAKRMRWNVFFLYFKHLYILYSFVNHFCFCQTINYSIAFHRISRKIYMSGVRRDSPLVIIITSFFSLTTCCIGNFARMQRGCVECLQHINVNASGIAFMAEFKCATVHLYDCAITALVTLVYVRICEHDLGHCALWCISFTPRKRSILILNWQFYEIPTIQQSGCDWEYIAAADGQTDTLCWIRNCVVLNK